MATGKVIGRVEVSIGNIKIVDVDGNLRDAGYEGLMYEGEQIYSDDVNALFQIKYLALEEATAYDGIFRVLADGSVISGLDGNENYFGDDIDFMETAAGGEGEQGSSAFLEEVPLDESSLLGFGRGADDTGYGEGIVDFGVISDTDQTPPIITSDNEIIFDENNPDAVMTVTAFDTSAITFSISGLDSGLFSIDPVTGVLTFNDSPDYESPQDAGGDNEYNILVTVTDVFGNFTTQLVSINVNNLNDNIPTADDAANTATEDVYDDVTGQLNGSDADGNIIRYELIDGLGEDEGYLTFGEDGSYTYNVGEDFQDLAVGETREVTFTYKTVEVGPPLSEPSDAGPFESETATVTITVTGTNDAPEITVGETGLTFVSESAGFNNVLGIYLLNEEGNPTNPQIIMTDTNSGGSYTTPIEYAFGSFGLFIIPNGDFEGIEEATLSFDGTQLLIDGDPVNIYFDNNDWNDGELDHFDVVANADGSVNVKIEDLNLGDNDRNDLEIKLTPIGGSVGGVVVELVDGSVGENVSFVFTDGTLDFDDVDLSDTHSVIVTATPNGDGYLGTFSASVTTPATGAGMGEISWNFDVHDSLLDSMGAYDSLVQTYTVTVDDGNGGTDTQLITITIQGTNDAPEVMAESITKVTDHITTTEVPEDATAITFAFGIIPFLPPLVTSDAAEVRIKTHGRYVVDDQNGISFFGFTLMDGDKEQFIDSKGFWNEGILFKFEGEVNQATLGFQAFGNHDRALVQLYNESGDVVGFKYVTSHNNLHQIEIDEGVSFTTLGIFALDNCNVTDFRITSITSIGEMDTVLPFVIDDTMLLANDTDVEGDSIHVELVDGRLLDAGGIQIGTVEINGDGDIEVTPNEDVEFTTDIPAYANFAYVVVDEHGAQSEEATATIDVALGTISGTQVGYVQDGPQEFIIGTDLDAPDALSDNILTIAQEGTLDLSHVSDMNTIELGEDATVTGSADLGHITAADVMDATDLDNTLIIHSSDGNAHDQVDVHESFGDSTTVFNDGQWYAEYSADGATLLVEIDPPIEVV